MGELLVERDPLGGAVSPPAARTSGGQGRRAGVGAVGVVALVAGIALLTGVLRVGATGADGAELGAEVPVTAMDQTRMPANNSPVVATDPTDSGVVAIANRVDAPDFGCALQMSGDSGRSWITAEPVPVLPAGAEKCYAPEVAFDRDGALYYLFVGLHGRGNQPMGAFLVRSTDRGRSFSPPQEVLGPLSFSVRMAIDHSIGESGRLHLVWLQASSPPALGGFVAEPNPILSSYSDDGGVTFSGPVQVSDPHRPRVVAPALVLGPDRAVHVAYYDLEDDVRDYQGLPGPVWEGNWSVVVATSRDGGRSFARGKVVDGEVVPPERPMLIFTMAAPALVADRDRVCAAWTDARHGDADVLLRCSPDQGETWEQERRLNDDPVGNGLRQDLPRLALAPDGRLDAVFLDRRHHPTNDRNDVTYTSSTDGGRSFAPNRRLTQASSRAAIGQRYEGPAAEGKTEMGARLGLVSHRSGVLVAWPDTRNSLQGTGQDIFAAQIEWPSHPTRLVRGFAAVLIAVGATTLGGAILGSRRYSLGRAGDGGAPVGDSSQHHGRRQMARRLASCAAVGLSVFIVVRLAGAAGGPGGVPPSPQVVDVTMREYAYEYRPPAHGGRVVFRVHNAGEEPHRIGIYPLPEDVPPIDEQLRGDERRQVDMLADVPTRLPGESQTFAVDLVPGRRYALLCFLPMPDGARHHADAGMNSEFRPAPAGHTPTDKGA